MTQCIKKLLLLPKKYLFSGIVILKMSIYLTCYNNSIFSLLNVSDVHITCHCSLLSFNYNMCYIA